MRTSSFEDLRDVRNMSVFLGVGAKAHASKGNNHLRRGWVMCELSVFSILAASMSFISTPTNLNISALKNQEYQDLYFLNVPPRFLETTIIAGIHLKGMTIQ